jgi:nicotinamidase/pyrazinamidase
MKALLLVDFQNDFMPGGALAVKDADQLIPIVNDLLKINFDFIVASKDWHPADHVSFALSHHKQPGEEVDLHGLKQVLWPVHCVQGTNGSEFVKGFDPDKIKKIFYKGVDKGIDSYSSFYDNEHKRSTGLESYLRKNGINDLYVAGLATEYCVQYSVLDALNLGFNVSIVKDACKAINLHPEDEEHAFKIMRRAGAGILTFSDIKKMARSENF